jgi:hypothetical protein
VARRLPSWLLALALATPLVGLTGWVIHGVTHPSGLVAAPPASAGVLPGLPPPRVDLPADRLEDRVDGAADALRADGCRRLLHWRFEEPPADAEVLVFRTDGGARAVMTREAGPERTPGPGDEAQASPQAVYFRRGAVYVRIFLDPGAVSPPDALARRAGELDQGLAKAGAL